MLSRVNCVHSVLVRKRQLFGVQKHLSGQLFDVLRLPYEKTNPEIAFA
jgi:hypothetical protein